MKETPYVPFDQLSIREKSLLSKIYNVEKIQRKDLKKMADVKNGTYYNSIEELLQNGMVRKENEGTTGKGRPSEVLYFNENYCHILYIFISKAIYSYSVMDLRGTILREEEKKYDVSITFDQILDEICSFYEQEKEQFNIHHIAITSGMNGVSIPSIYVNPTMLEHNLGEELSKKLGLTYTTETISRSCALGMARQRNNPEESFIYMNFSSGIGMGVISNGKLLDFGNANPKIEHMIIRENGKRCSCGQHGCAITYVGTINLVQNIKRDLLIGIPSSLGSVKDLKFADIIQAADNGDKLVLDFYEEIVKAMKILFHNLACIFHPDFIVAGGTLLKNNPLLRTMLEEAGIKSKILFEENFRATAPIGIAGKVMNDVLSTEKGVIID